MKQATAPFIAKGVVKGGGGQRMIEGHETLLLKLHGTTHIIQ